MPFLERLDRLDVVVAVAEDGGRVRVGGGPLGEDSGQGAGGALPDFGDREAGRAKVPREPLGAAPHVGVVIRVSRDGRDRQPLLQRVDELTRVRLHIVTDIHAFTVSREGLSDHRPGWRGRGGPGRRRTAGPYSCGGREWRGGNRLPGSGAPSCSCGTSHEGRALAWAW